MLFRNPAAAVNVPTIVNYQAKLLQSGASVTTTKAMSFLLFDSLTTGSLLYTASGTLSATNTLDRTPENGIFNVQLGGSGTNTLDPGIFQRNSAVYLEVWVEGQRLTPRKQITTAPYAFNSQYLMGFSATTTSSTIYIPISDDYGNFTFTGTASTTGVNGGIIYINPTSAGANLTLFGIADNGTERLRVDKEGDAWLFGALNVSSTLNVAATSTLATTTITSLNVDSGTFFVDNINNRVGVNSSTPSYDLAVNGTSWFTGTTTIADWFNVQGKVARPTHKGSLAHGTGGASLDGPMSIFVSGNYAYVVSTGGTLEIADVSNPRFPVHKGSLSNGTGGALLGDPFSIYISGNYAYITSALGQALEIVDISDPTAPVHKGSLANGVGGAMLTDPYSVFVSGNYAYIASYSSNALEIVDVSNPRFPIHKGSLSNGVGGALLDGPYSVHVSGKYAYVASYNSNALEIIDVSNPTNPTHKGSIAHGAGGAVLSGPRSVFVSGNYAYVAANSSSALEVIDISSSTAPVHKGSLTNGAGGALLGGPTSVYVSGDYAYIAANTSNALEIIDITSSTAPTHKGSISNGAGGALLSGANSIFISGNYAYVAANGSNALEIIDISGATISNAEIGTTKTTNLQVMNSALFDQSVNIRGGLSIGSNGLLLSGDFGMSSPTSTDVLTATNTLGFSHTALFKTAATGTDEAAFIFDTVNTLTAANLLSVRNNGTVRLALDQAGNLGVNTSTPSFNLSVSGTAYISGNSIFNNVSSTNITATNMTASGYLNVDSGTFYVDNTNNRIGVNSTTPMYDLAVNGTSWFTGTSTHANLLDVQGRVGNPIHKGNISSTTVGILLDQAQSVYVSGNYAYVASGISDALEIIDISNPARPTHKGSIADGAGGARLDNPNSVFVSGNYAYVASQSSASLEIIDISNPSQPTHKGSVRNNAGGALLSGVTSVFVSGNYAYLTASSVDALEIIDVSNPSTPTHKGSISNGAGGALLDLPVSVYVVGNYAYVASADSDALEIIDVSDPAVPTHKGSIATGVGGSLLDFSSVNSDKSVFVSGNYAYLAVNSSNALEIVDISSSTAPIHGGSIANGTDGAKLTGADSVFVSGNYAYVAASNSDALEIVDISSSTAPVHKSSLSNGTGGALLDGATSVFVSGNYAYVASHTSDALEIIDISGATISNAEIGTTKTTNLQVMSSALFDQNVSIRGGLSIGSNGLLLSGDFGMSSPTTTDVLTATNTLGFSHTALFRTAATGTDEAAFIFDTVNTLSAANLLSVRNNGTVRLALDQSGNLGVNTSTPS
ncbi:MAG: hypothetical protein AAB390_04945, partial [Patescibacteria group bacterium]